MTVQEEDSKSSSEMATASVDTLVGDAETTSVLSSPLYIRTGKLWSMLAGGSRTTRKSFSRLCVMFLAHCDLQAYVVAMILISS